MPLWSQKPVQYVSTLIKFYRCIINCFEAHSKFFRRVNSRDFMWFWLPGYSIVIATCWCPRSLEEPPRSTLYLCAFKWAVRKAIALSKKGGKCTHEWAPLCTLHRPRMRGGEGWHVHTHTHAARETLITWNKENPVRKFPIECYAEVQTQRAKCHNWGWKRE